MHNLRMRRRTEKDVRTSKGKNLNTMPENIAINLSAAVNEIKTNLNFVLYLPNSFEKAKDLSKKDQ